MYMQYTFAFSFENSLTHKLIKEFFVFKIGHESYKQNLNCMLIMIKVPKKLKTRRIKKFSFGPFYVNFSIMVNLHIKNQYSISNPITRKTH